MIDGLEADVVTLALAYDIDAIADKGLLPADWQKRLPHNSSPYTSTIVFLVRKGNPKGIKDWDDLVKPRRQRHHAQSEDLGRRALGLSGGLGLRARRSTAARGQGQASSSATLYKNVPVLDTGARGSTITFVAARHRRRAAGLGERGVSGAQGIRRGQVRDRRSVGLASWPSRRWRWSTRWSTSNGTRAVAEAYLKYLYTNEGQEIAAKQLLPSARSPTSAKQYAGSFPKVKLFTIDDVFGGWPKAQSDPLRRRRRVRPDLQELTVRKPANVAGSASRPTQDREHGIRRARCRASA